MFDDLRAAPPKLPGKLNVHVFHQVGGGCGCGNPEHNCDDEYVCMQCGKSFTVLSDITGHVNLPRDFIGREECHGEPATSEDAEKLKAYRRPDIAPTVAPVQVDSYWRSASMSPMQEPDED